MRQLLTTLAECAGFVLCAVGVGLVHVPSALMFAGGSLVAVGVLSGRDA